jgi:hypothetical protein
MIPTNHPDQDLMAYIKSAAAAASAATQPDKTPLKAIILEKTND